MSKCIGLIVLRLSLANKFNFIRKNRDLYCRPRSTLEAYRKLCFFNNSRVCLGSKTDSETPTPPKILLECKISTWEEAATSDVDVVMTKDIVAKDAPLSNRVRHFGQAVIWIPNSFCNFTTISQIAHINLIVQRHKSTGKK